MVESKKISGVITALVTPFFQGEIDFDSLTKLVKNQILRGINSFVVNGTTAESPTLSEQEAISVLKFIRKEFPDSYLIFGAGSNSTSQAIKLSKLGVENGADALLSVVPYYNKPTQEGLFLHFKEIASATEAPILLYNVPGRTITSLSVETIAALSKIDNIVGIKEASGSMEFAKEIKENTGSDFILLSGDDGTFDEFMLVGGQGIISVCSHLIPEVMCGIYRTSGKDNKVFKSLKNFIDSLYIEPNPIPTKYALQNIGLIRTFECRLPLTSLSLKSRSQVEQCLELIRD